MDIKLERYRIFCSVYESGSLSSAANMMFLTQSAVSQHIKALEDSLGTILFIRSRSGIQPTQAGHLLYQYASQALSLIRTAEKKFTDISSLEDGSLSVGASDTICSHYLMPVLEQYHRLYPGIHLNITNRVTSETVDELKGGKIDIAFINLPYRKAEADRFLTIKEQLPLHEIFVASPEYVSAIPHALSPDEIASYPLIMLENKSNTRNYVDSFFLSRQITLSPEFELGSHALLLEFASANLGIACVTKEFSQKQLDSGRLVEIQTTDPIPPRSLGVCSLTGVPLSHAAGAFLSLLYNTKL